MVSGISKQCMGLHLQSCNYNLLRSADQLSLGPRLLALDVDQPSNLNELGYLRYA